MKKRVFILLLCLIILFLVASCNENNVPTDTNKTDEIADTSEKIEYSDELVYEIGATYDFSSSVVSELTGWTLESNSDVISIISNQRIKAEKIGEATLVIKRQNNESNINVKVKVVENEAPVFKKYSTFKENLTANYGEELNITQGLKVNDNCDGVITESVTVENPEDLLKFGTREITLLATDRAGNQSTFKRTITIEWPYQTKFIGHQGCVYAVPNTEEAFLYAVQVMHYQALECDLKSTKDGVLVISHDNDFGGMEIATHTYEELSKVVKTYEQFALPETKYGSKTYTGHICKFETYLDICKDYGVQPIIELKGAFGMTENNTSQLIPLMNLLREKGLYEQAVILTAYDVCISYLRSKGETVKCQYLVNGANTDAIFNFCNENHCDISVNVTYGQGISDSYIKKYHNAGLEVSVWTFTSYCDYELVQKWIDKGVDYLTCDWQYFTKGDLTLK